MSPSLSFFDGNANAFWANNTMRVTSTANVLESLVAAQSIDVLAA